MRRKLVDQLAEQAAEPEGLAPFERFRDLMRRLVAVPKNDLDAAADAEKKAKADRASAP